MPSWAVQQAKAKFSEFLKATVEQGPQVVTYHGEETAVLVPMEEYRKLKAASRPPLKQWLLAPTPKFEIPLRPRKEYSIRPLVEFD